MIAVAITIKIGGATSLAMSNIFSPKSPFPNPPKIFPAIFPTHITALPSSVLCGQEWERTIASGH